MLYKLISKKNTLIMMSNFTHSFFCFVKRLMAMIRKNRQMQMTTYSPWRNHLHTLTKMTRRMRRTMRILTSRCPKNLREKILKMTSSDNDVDGDPLDVLTPTIMEHCFIMYNHNVYLVQVLKLRGHFKWTCTSTTYGGGARIHILNLKQVRLLYSSYVLPYLYC